jgi:hypothetical protein
MLKFLLGTATGALLAFVFVRFDLEPPAILDVPEKVKKSVVATVIEGDLYDLARDDETRTRALEVYFKTRAGDAAKLDARAGHPFLNALYRERARRDAGVLLAEWTAFDAALAQPALRKKLETKHDTTETDPLKQAMLLEALAQRPFLKSWLNQTGDAPTRETLRERLQATAGSSALPPGEP